MPSVAVHRTQHIFECFFVLVFMIPQLIAEQNYFFFSNIILVFDSPKDLSVARMRAYMHFNENNLSQNAHQLYQMFNIICNYLFNKYFSSFPWCFCYAKACTHSRLWQMKTHSPKTNKKKYFFFANQLYEVMKSRKWNI